MIYEFNAVLTKLKGKLPWVVFYIPFSVKEEFGINGRMQVRTFIDHYQFEGILLPSHNGHYMVFNKDFQQICKKGIGDRIHVKLEKEDTIHTLEIPHIIIEKLKVNNKIFDLFNQLPYYIKKEEIKKIMSAKQEITRLNRIDKLISKLIDSVYKKNLHW